MLDAFRHDEHLAGAKRHGAVAQLDVEHALEHEEEIIGIVVLVPDEFALELRNHHVVAVVGGHCAWRENIREGGELLGEIDAVHWRLRLRAGFVPSRASISRATFAAGSSLLPASHSSVIFPDFARVHRTGSPWLAKP